MVRKKLIYHGFLIFRGEAFSIHIPGGWMSKLACHGTPCIITTNKYETTTYSTKTEEIHKMEKRKILYMSILKVNISNFICQKVWSVVYSIHSSQAEARVQRPSKWSVGQFSLAHHCTFITFYSPGTTIESVFGTYSILLILSAKWLKIVASWT